MKTEPSTSPDTNAGDWQLPDFSTPFPEGLGRSAEDWANYCRILSAAADTAALYGWSKAEVAARTGIAPGTFNQYSNKTYQGRYDLNNDKIEEWLDLVADVQAMEARIPSAPKFLKLKSSIEFMESFTVAQAMPGIVICAADAGIGKTFTAEYYKATRANVHLTTMSPMTRTYTAMLTQIAEDIGVTQANRGQSLLTSIGRKLQRAPGGTLLIIDECQHLSDEAINQARVFFDKYKCGIALVGNSETYSRFADQWTGGQKNGQLRRRVFKRVNRPSPHAEDVDQFIRAWGITDAEIAAMLKGIAMKPGHLGQVNQTLKLAKMRAAGKGEPLTLKGLKSAWKNRNVEA